MSRKFGWLLAGVAALAPVAPATAACRAAGATYVSVDDPGFTVGLVAKPAGGGFSSDLAIYVRSAATRRTLWYLFDSGSGRYMHLISTMDVTGPEWRPPDPDGPRYRPYPRMEMQYLQADAGLHFRYQAPRQSEAAPEYILLPDLAEKMWYVMEPREAAPIGVFKLTGCDSSTAAN
jgi:hypothetical protein